jgi:hypothetical protein
MHFVDQHDEVVAQDFAHGLVFHGGRPLVGIRGKAEVASAIAPDIVTPSLSY